MQKAKYIFKINNTVVYPRYKSLKKKLALESGQRFFRTSLEGDIILGGIDYQLVKNANLETLFNFNILKLSTVTNNFEPYFEGSFSKTDCKFNNDTRTVKLKIKAKDAYTEVLKNYEHEYDLVQLAPAITDINLTKRPIVQVYVAGANSISSFIGGTYWEDEVNTVVTNKEELLNKYYFSQVSEVNELKMEISPNNYLGGVFTGQNGNYSSADYTLNVEYRDIDAQRFRGWYYALKQNGVKLYESAYFKENRSGTVKYLIPGVTETVIGADLNFYKQAGDAGFAYVTAVDTITTSVYQRILTDARSIEGTSTHVLPADDIYTNSGNYRRVIGLKFSNIFYSDKVVDEPTKYGKNTAGKYFTDKILPSSAGLGKVYPVCRNFWANLSFWLEVTTTNYDWLDSSASVEYSMRDGIRISEAIKAILKKVDSTLAHEASEEYSEFLYSTSNPIINRPLDIYITPKTNILAGSYDQAAQKGKLTFKDLMDMLATCYKCFWFIDGNKFRIEHVSWFNQGGSYIPNTQAILDLTSLKDVKTGKSFAFYSNTLEFDKTDLASRFEFNWMDEVTPTFSGSPINIKSNYIEESKKDSLTATKFSTDIDLMLCKPDEFSKDGFALFSVVTTDNIRKIPIVALALKENDEVYTVKAQNGYNSWFFLFNFYMSDLPAIQLSADIILASFWVAPSIIKCMKQNVSFPSAEDPQIFSLINTYNGEGQMNDMQIDLDTRQVEVTLYYKPS